MNFQNINVIYVKKLDLKAMFTLYLDEGIKYLFNIKFGSVLINILNFLWGNKTKFRKMFVGKQRIKIIVEYSFHYK